MPTDAQSDRLREQQIRQACEELDRRLRAGESFTTEKMLANVPELASDSNFVLDLIYTEWVTREELGARPNPAEFYQRFPQWREQIERLLDVHGAIGGESAGHSIAPGETPFNLPSTVIPRRGENRTIVERRERIGQYILLEKLGVGGMGVVYKARQPGLHRVVALKLLRVGEHAPPQQLSRFRAEAEAAARLQHPNIVQIYEVGEHDGSPFLSLEYVDGGNLEEQLGSAPVPAHVAARLVELLARAAHYAHQRGVVHRDLKPANVLMQAESGGQSAEIRSTTQGSLLPLFHPLSALRPKIADFGLAKLLAPESTDANSAGRTPSLTHTGDLLGTPGYMSPEQALGRSHEIGPATDVYALGAILYRTLTGRAPFQGDSLLETLEQIRRQDPVAPRRLRPTLPRDLNTICLKCLEKEAARRYATAHELAEDLRRFQVGEAIVARPILFWERALKWAKRRPAAAGLVVASAIATIALVGVAVCFFYSVRLARAYETADAARIAADQSRLAEARERTRAEAARAEAELYLYFNRIVLAEHEWRTNNVPRAEQLLDLCPSDLRDWEWHYLKRLCHSELHTFQGHGDRVNRLAISADGRWLASASNDKTVRVWDMSTRRQVRILTGHTQWVDGVAFSPDGKHMASAAGDFSEPGELIIWEVESGRESLRISGQTGQQCNVAFAPDGRRVAATSGEWDKPHQVKIWDATSGEELFTKSDFDQAAVTVQFSPDGRHLAAGFGTWNVYNLEHKPGEVKVWDAETREELLVLRGHTGPLISIAYSPDGERLVSTSWDRSAKVWELTTRREIFALRGHTHWVTTAAFSRDGKQIATGSEDGSARIWDAATGLELLTLRGHGRPVAGVAFSAEGNYLVTCSDDKTLKLWDAHVAPEATLLGEFDSWVNHVAFSRDGKQIAAGAVDRSIRVWDSSTGAVLIERRDLPSPVWSVRFSPDGRRLACGLGDWTKPDQPAETKILDAMTGREYYSLRGHQALVWSVAFSPDGERIATARFIARTQKLIECFLRLAYIGDVTLITAVHFVIHPTHCSIFESLATGDEPLSIHINVKHATREQPVAKPSMNTNHVMQMSP